MDRAHLLHEPSSKWAASSIWAGPPTRKFVTLGLYFQWSHWNGQVRLASLDSRFCHSNYRGTCQSFYLFVEQTSPVLCSEQFARTAHLVDDLPSIWAEPVCSMNPRVNGRRRVYGSAHLLENRLRKTGLGPFARQTNKSYDMSRLRFEWQNRLSTVGNLDWPFHGDHWKYSPTLCIQEKLKWNKSYRRLRRRVVRGGGGLTSYRLSSPAQNLLLYRIDGPHSRLLDFLASKWAWPICLIFLE